MSKAFSQNYFFIKEGAKTIISVNGHSYAKKDGDEWRELNASIEITAGSPFTLKLSLPKEDLKKLMVAIKKFLESGKLCSFYYDEFRFGEYEERETTPAKEMLSGA